VPSESQQVEQWPEAHVERCNECLNVIGMSADRPWDEPCDEHYNTTHETYVPRGRVEGLVKALEKIAKAKYAPDITLSRVARAALTAFKGDQDA